MTVKGLMTAKEGGVRPTAADSIRVYVRVRPPSTLELLAEPRLRDDALGSLGIASGPTDEAITNLKADPGCAIWIEPGGSDRTFHMSGVFTPKATQREVYEGAAKGIVDSVLEGFNGAVIAYGQTNSGKTYTMEGLHDSGVTDCLSAAAGIIPQAIATIFNFISLADEHMEFQLKMSILEIYMEAIRDLLNPGKVHLKLREEKTRGVYVEDLTECFVTSPRDVLTLLQTGQHNRATAATLENAESSRSHLIVCISVQQRNTFDMTTKTGRLYLVDLAGSEKVSRTGAEGQLLDEAKMINKSLASLGNVINALTMRPSGASASIYSRKHIPYRDSKLTRVLQETLGGNAKTCLICTVSPAAANESETLSTLRFGQRAKMIRNVAVINRARSPEALEKLLARAEARVASVTDYAATLVLALQRAGLQVPQPPTGINGMASAPLTKEDGREEDPQLSARSNEELNELLMAKDQKLTEQSELISKLKVELAEASRVQWTIPPTASLPRRTPTSAVESVRTPSKDRAEERLLFTPDLSGIPSSEKLQNTPVAQSYDDDPEISPIGAVELEMNRARQELEEEKKRNLALRRICRESNPFIRGSMRVLEGAMDRLRALSASATDQGLLRGIEAQGEASAHFTSRCKELKRFLSQNLNADLDAGERGPEENIAPISETHASLLAVLRAEDAAHDSQEEPESAPRTPSSETVSVASHSPSSGTSCLQLLQQQRARIVKAVKGGGTDRRSSIILPE